MHRREFLSKSGRFVAGGASFFAVAHLLSCGKRDRSNVLFILVDDLGWSQLGCYGSTFYRTPNIDRLASEGVRFTNAYAAAPVCSPTRASIVTGKYPARLHLTDFIPGGNPPPDSKLRHPEWNKHLLLEETTIAEALRQEGYATACFGKWHLSPSKTPPGSLTHNPDKQGFDEFFVTYKPVPALAKPWQSPENDAHNVEIITQKSLTFIDENKHVPFFLFVSHNTIHGPLKEKESLIEEYRTNLESELPENNPIIGAMLETLDLSIGRLLKKLDELGLTERTIVIFYSDNGGLERLADQSPLRGGKASLYEGGIRVPLIIRWPQRAEPGGVDSSLVTSVDFFPTLIEAAGSQRGYEHIDGVSLMPVLAGSGELSRDTIFWHYPHYHSAGDAPSGAIRKGEYKLIEWYEESLLGLENQIELYNLKEDVGENVNLALRMPEKAEELRDRLKAWRQSVGAQMPTRNRMSGDCRIKLISGMSN